MKQAPRERERLRGLKAAVFRPKSVAIAFTTAIAVAFSMVPRDVQGAKRKPMPTAATTATRIRQLTPEQRLHAIYVLISTSQWNQAISQAALLVKDHPRFQLAQLVYGDLLLSRTQSLPEFAAVPSAIDALTLTSHTGELRAEARQRFEGFKKPPPPGKIPKQFLELPPSTRQALAIDTSRSRLYVFENQEGALKLVADHYVSLGKLGVEKQIEGDQRTPLGVYFITSRLSEKQIDPNFGVGALPLNYPNEYDRRLGKTGSGIWLHGVPINSYSRPPNSTDGCIALANEELTPLLRSVEALRTPVVISQRIDWVDPQSLKKDREEVHALLEQWRIAQSGSKVENLAPLYSQQFQSGPLDLEQWMEKLNDELTTAKGHSVVIKNISVLTWKYRSEVMVVTFNQIRVGSTVSRMTRQYWGKENGQWKIFFEGISG